MEQEIYEKIIQKKQFSEIPRADVERAYARFDRLDEEDRIKKTRWLLTNIFSGFGGKKLLVWKNKSAEEVLQKHLSTRERMSVLRRSSETPDTSGERHENYEEIYSRLLKNLPSKISVLDFGAGVNGFSYNFFEKVGKEVDYIGVEAVGQLVKLTNDYFKENKLKNAVAVHESLFELEKVKKLIMKTKTPRVVFMFKVVDALKSLERNYTKNFLKEIMPSVERLVISFPTESWMKRTKFFAQRNWLIDFIKEEGWNFIDDFNVGGERYLVVEK